MRPDFIEWAESPSGVYLPDKEKPTLATWQPYQVDILRHVFPAGEGRLPYAEFIWSEPKKSGKTTTAAACHLYFALFVAMPGEQYVLANDLEGASDRTFQAIRGCLEIAARQKGSLIRDGMWREVGTKIVLRDKRGETSIKALANDYKGGAGGNQSFVTIDEVWGFTRPSDLGLLTEFAPVPTRENSMTMYTGYQGYEGESNYWHDLIDGVVAAGEPVPELAHIEDGDGKPACWRHGRTFLFYSHLCRHPWHTEEYLTGRRARMPLSEYLRVWENRRVKNSSTLCTDAEWDRLYDPELRALYPDDKRMVVVGVDAATKKDAAAVVAVTLNPVTHRYEVVFCRVWQPQGEPLKLTETVGPAIVELHRNYRVLATYYDNYQMAAISEICQRAGVTMVDYPQTAARLESDTLLQDSIRGNNLAHYGDPVLREHITNAVVKVQKERGVRIFKELTSKKVDAAVALAMAMKGATEYLGRGETGRLGMGENPFFR